MTTVECSPSIQKLLFVSHSCWLDDSSGAMVASRAMMKGLAKLGYRCTVFTGDKFDHDKEVDLAFIFEKHAGFDAQSATISTISDANGFRDSIYPRQLHSVIDEIDVNIEVSGSTRSLSSSGSGRDSFINRFQELLDRFEPELTIGFGGDESTQCAFRLAKSGGSRTIFALHNFSYFDDSCFASIDQIIVPSTFAANVYRERLGLDCKVLPNFIDHDRIAIDEKTEEQFLTFVNPSPEKGVWYFARIAKELGRLRPDIPILVVESRGTESTLVNCGLDLREHSNVYIMNHTNNPKKIWKRTKLCLMPSLWWENQPLTAIEAMSNGIPVICSDRGGLPETVGSGGIILNIPERFRPDSEELPTPNEVITWIEMILKLWDDPREYARLSALSKSESMRWNDDIVKYQYRDFIENLLAK